MVHPQQSPYPTGKAIHSTHDNRRLACKRLKLEIDEWLDIAALDLNNHICHNNDEQRRSHYTTFLQQLYSSILQRTWKPMRHECQQHHGKHPSVCNYDLWQHLGIELRKQLAYHSPGNREVLIAEEYPSQTQKVERKNDSH